MDTTVKELVWTTALGQKIPVSQISHQHLSNIIWFHHFFNGWVRSNSREMSIMWDRIDKEFDGVLLTWKPLPIPEEVAWIHRTGNLDEDGNIWFFAKSKIIGSVSHIPNWKELI